MAEELAASAMAGGDGASNIFVKLEELAPGTQTLSWAAISIGVNCVFLLGWIVCSFFDIGVRWDIAAVLVSNGFGKVAKLYLPRCTRGPVRCGWSFLQHSPGQYWLVPVKLPGNGTVASKAHPVASRGWQSHFSAGHSTSRRRA